MAEEAADFFLAFLESEASVKEHLTDQTCLGECVKMDTQKLYLPAALDRLWFGRRRRYTGPGKGHAHSGVGTH